MGAKKPSEPEPTGKDEAVLCPGMPAVPGIASRPVFVWKPGVAGDLIPRRCVLVARMTRPEIVAFADRIDAIVTEIGGRLCHAAILALEKNIPCVVGNGNALKVLLPGMPVTVDGSAGGIYRA